MVRHHKEVSKYSELLIQSLGSLKYFLIGWVCIGSGFEQQCLRNVSEVTFPDYEECNQYYNLVTEDLRDLDTVKINFTCVQAATLEDLL